MSPKPYGSVRIIDDKGKRLCRFRGLAEGKRGRMVFRMIRKASRDWLPFVEIRGGHRHCILCKHRCKHPCHQQHDGENPIHP